MNPIFSLKNFRSFGENGADFELAPITVLTGCNSAGKSSLVKALELMSEQSTGETMLKGYLNIKRIMPSASLNTMSHDLRLGGFNNVINEHNKDGDLTISYRMWSDYLQEEIVCKRVFHAKKNVLNEGQLSYFTIEKLDGTIIYKATPESYIETLPVGINGQLQDCVIDYMEEDDNHFNEIENNYQRFILACRYIYYSEKINTISKIKIKREDIVLNNKENYQAKYEEVRKQIGDIIPDDYNFEHVSLWNNRWDLRNNVSSEIEKLYFKDRTDEELSRDDKEVFYTLVINEIVSPWFIKMLLYIDSSTNEIRRIYNVENTDKLSKLLCLIMKSKQSSTYQTGPFVNKWLKQFNIGNSIEIIGTDEGLGVKIYLEKNGGKHLLADEGYGITQLISILMQIELSIETHSHYDPINDAYVSLKRFICIEEPEVHLHPKYQSLLADMFMEAYQIHNIRFIIETHSEYLIRKLQVLIAGKENTITSNDVSLNYVEKDKDGISYNRQIKILEDGRLSKPFGDGFYDEADTLAMELMKFKVRK